MALKETYAFCEHSIASITCLLAGFRIFDTTYNTNERNLRILKGLHGFHIYATEYWLEDLLCSNATICDDHEVASLLYLTAKALADRLNTARLSAEISVQQESDTLDTRLDKFANLGAIYDMLRSALRERSTKATSDQTKQETCMRQIDVQGFVIKLIVYFSFYRYYRARTTKSQRPSSNLPSQHPISIDDPFVPRNYFRGIGEI